MFSTGRGETATRFLKYPGPRRLKWRQTARESQRMKMFIVVIVVATIIGGFVGGELMDKTLSLLGAVIGGVGLTTALLGLGAYFTAQEEKKKKKNDLPPEMRGVLDRMFGGQGFSSVPKTRGWRARPFFENKTKGEFVEWFSNVPPWNKLDTRIAEILIDRFGGDPIFEVFVHVSHERNLVPKYAALQSLVGVDGGKFSICPRIAMILASAAEDSRSAIAMALKRGNQNDLKKHYGHAVDALESAIKIEPNIALLYLQIATLKASIGKNEDARRFCKAGLERIQKLKSVPFHKSSIESVRNARSDMEEIESDINALLSKLSV